MKAIVLAGGYATRLWPMTKYLAKPLLPLKGKPIVSHIVEKVEELDDVDEIFVSTNKRFEEQFGHWLSTNGFRKRVRLVIEPTTRENEKFGAIKGIHYLLQKEGIDDDLLIIAGDNVFGADLRDVVEEMKRERKVVVAFHDIGDREKARRFGVGILDESGHVVDFEEKPENPRTTFVSTVIYAMPKEHLSLFDEYMKTPLSKDSPGNFIQWLHRKVPVKGFVFDEHWFDIGTFESYEECLRHYNDLNASMN